MRLFRRQKAVTVAEPRTEPVDGHPEPIGHVHPDYRHLTWFRPEQHGEMK